MSGAGAAPSAPAGPHALAREGPIKSKLHKQHRWLKRLLGDWSHEMEANMGPDKPPARFKGTERVRAIGDLWIVAEGRCPTPRGGTATMILTLGYDPATKRFVGTWIGSMMSHLWIYDGALSRDGTTLTLNTVGPNIALKGKTAAYREVIRFKNRNHRVFTSSMRDQRGKWIKFVTAHHRRKK